MTVKARGSLAFLGLTLAVALAGCQQDLKFSNNGGVPSRDVRSCAVAGGTIEARGKLRTPVCVLPYSDGGRSCTGKKDCKGRCIATSGADGLPKLGEAVAGHCQPDNKLFGCYAEVEGGKAKAAICVD